MRNTGSLNLRKVPKDSCDSIFSICVITKEISFSEEECPNGVLKEPIWKCRHAVTFISFLIFLSSSINRTIMSIVIVAMVNNTAINQNSKAESETCLDVLNNSTNVATVRNLKSEGEMIWSPETQGYILGCFFLGHVFSLIPAGRLAERYGCKWILVGSLLIISILTMLIPPFSHLSTSAVIVIQTLKGLAQGMLGPCVTILIANWCPKSERGFLYSITQTAQSLGPALGNIFAGYVSDSPRGWPYAFYIVGGSGLILAMNVLFFLTENPKEHPNITKAELNFILSQQEGLLSRKRPKLPWRQVFTSVPVYALLLAIFGRYWMLSQFWIVHSTFLGTILHYQIGQNGLLSAVPFFLAFLTSLVATWISGYTEKRKVLSVNFLRKFWILSSSLLYSACLLGIYFAGCNRPLSAIFSILSMGFAGLGTPGCSIVKQDMSPTFAGTLHSLCHTIGFMSSMILPLVVGYLTDESQTLEQWNKVFFISIGIVMSSAITFLFFGSAKIQPWNFVEENDEGKNEKNIEKY